MTNSGYIGDVGSSLADGRAPVAKSKGELANTTLSLVVAII